MDTIPTVADLRIAYPEFTAEAFPDAQVQYQIGLASRLTGKRGFGSLWSDAILALAAHSLALAWGRSQQAGVGGVGGVPSGAVTSKSVGGASISYDASVGNIDGAGLYAATSYGRQYYAWARRFGAGGIQL